MTKRKQGLLYIHHKKRGYFQVTSIKGGHITEKAKKEDT
jgi:hypothetical protein